MTVLITGANRGIGAALARTYRKMGKNVIGTARSGDDFWKLDVTREADFPALEKRLQDTALSLLICNAGIYADKGLRDEQRDAQVWARSFAVNVTGVYLTVQACLPALRRGAGKIALLGSAMGSDQRAPGGSYAYRASKAALLNLGRNFAADLDLPVGIYHPGWVRTDMGGDGADIAVEDSVSGLIARFTELDRGSSGCFLSYDGKPVPF